MSARVTGIQRMFIVASEIMAPAYRLHVHKSVLYTQSRNNMVRTMIGRVNGGQAGKSLLR